MKINEVEACVSITKKNIRFYESEGLLTPQRNSGNGYREYGELEVDILKRIKLLRKLGFPLEEIRKMQSGTLTIADGMQRHRVTLERESKNLQQSITLCNNLSQTETTFNNLDASSILDEISNLESKGASFHNEYEKDRKINMFTAILISFLIIIMMVALNCFILWEMYRTDSFLLPVACIIITTTACIILALLFVLFTRLKEITKGEIEQAKRY